MVVLDTKKIKYNFKWRARGGGGRGGGSRAGGGGGASLGVGERAPRKSPPIKSPRKGSPARQQASKKFSKKISENNSYSYHCGDSFNDIFDSSMGKRRSDTEILEKVSCKKNDRGKCKFIIKKTEREIKPIDGLSNIFSTRSCIGFKNHGEISKKCGCSVSDDVHQDPIKKYLSELKPDGIHSTKEHIYSLFEKLAKYVILTEHSLNEILSGAFIEIKDDGGWFYDVITENNTSDNIYMRCEQFKGSSHKSSVTQCRVGKGSLKCMNSPTISNSFDLLFGKNSHDDTWFQFEGARGTVRDDGTVNMANFGHTVSTVDYGARRIANQIGQVITFGYSGPQLIASNVGPCGHSKFNDSNPLVLQLKHKIQRNTGNRTGRAAQIIENR